MDPLDPSSTGSGLPTQEKFDEGEYLRLNPDVAAAVGLGRYDSGWHHFKGNGLAEGRHWVPRAPLEGSAPSREVARLAEFFTPLTVPAQVDAADEMLVAGNEPHYFRAGSSALYCIDAALLAARRARAEIRTILDLPSGHGRVLRFLKAAFPHAKLTACDLDSSAVAFCARTFGAIPVVSDVDVSRIPLNGKFDLIWCGSLLTHLPESQWGEFLKFFRQLLGPAAILVFTTHGRLAGERLATGTEKYGLNDRRVANLLRDYRGKGFGYVEYSDGSGYGLSLASPAVVVERLLAISGWTLLGYHEAGWDNHQDVVALQREP